MMAFHRMIMLMMMLQIGVLTRISEYHNSRSLRMEIGICIIMHKATITLHLSLDRLMIKCMLIPFHISYSICLIRWLQVGVIFQMSVIRRCGAMQVRILTMICMSLLKWLMILKYIDLKITKTQMLQSLSFQNIKVIGGKT